MVVLLKLLLTWTTTFIKLNITPTGAKVSFLKGAKEKIVFFNRFREDKNIIGILHHILTSVLSLMIGMMFSSQFAIHSDMLV